MKKDAGSNYPGMKSQLYIALIVAAVCLVGFLRIDLRKMEM